jgi:hypothetical protein
VTGENPANDVFVDLDVERQGDLLCDWRQPRLGLRCFISIAKWMSSALDHKAMSKRKYRMLFSPNRHRKPGPKG